MSDTTILKVSLAELKFIWTLGLDTGLVHGHNGLMPDEKNALFNEDVKRLEHIDSNLARRIVSATESKGK